MGYSAELQALRELAHYVLPLMKCCFCGETLMSFEEAEKSGFGHRRHRGIKVEFTMHHLDRNRSNNSIVDNIRISHSKCHRAHHAKERSLKSV